MCHEQADAIYLPLAELVDYQPDEVFSALEYQPLVCLDDTDAVAGNRPWEEALFHLMNRKLQAGGVLLVSASQVPARLFELPDLVSRLGWGITYTLKPLGDEDVLASLACRARGRGLELPEETAQYLLRRFPRDLPTLFALFDTLDTASLIEQRRLTIPFVKSVLDNQA